MDRHINTINRRVHIEKKGIRVFGIAESFRKSDSRSTLAGLVMRRDLVIDGVAFGFCTLRGDDSTDTILSMFNSLQRTDLNCIILDGLIISMYNIIDGEYIHRETGLPIIAISFNETRGLIEEIIRHFPAEQQKMKLDNYFKIGRRNFIILKTGKHLFIRCWGINDIQALRILNAFTLQGSIPEPIRVAKLFARARQIHNTKDM